MQAQRHPQTDWCCARVQVMDVACDTNLELIAADSSYSTQCKVWVNMAITKDKFHVCMQHLNCKCKPGVGADYTDAVHGHSIELASWELHPSLFSQHLSTTWFRWSGTSPLARDILTTARFAMFDAALEALTIGRVADGPRSMTLEYLLMDRFY